MLLRPETFGRLCLARDLLHEAPDEAPLTVRDVAREVGLSPFHMIRQFEAVFGLTPHQYRIGVRLDRARDLLARGELSVTEVCMHLGFSSPGQLQRVVHAPRGREPVGLPPSRADDGPRTGPDPAPSGAGLPRPHDAAARRLAAQFSRSLTPAAVADSSREEDP